MVVCGMRFSLFFLLCGLAVFGQLAKASEYDGWELEEGYKCDNTFHKRGKDNGRQIVEGGNGRRVVANVSEAEKKTNNIKDCLVVCAKYKDCVAVSFIPDNAIDKCVPMRFCDIGKRTGAFVYIRKSYNDVKSKIAGLECSCKEQHLEKHTLATITDCISKCRDNGNCKVILWDALFTNQPGSRVHKWYTPSSGSCSLFSSCNEPNCDDASVDEDSPTAINNAIIPNNKLVL